MFDANTHYLFLKDVSNKEAVEVKEDDTLLRFIEIGPDLFELERWDRDKKEWVCYIKGLFRLDMIPPSSFQVESHYSKSMYRQSITSRY